MRMIRCESDYHYEELWKEFNSQLLNAPFLPEKKKLDVENQYSMTPELGDVIKKKDEYISSFVMNSDSIVWYDKVLQHMTELGQQLSCSNDLN